MPKYSFECPVCNLRFERNLKIGGYPTHECPSCGDPAPLVISDFGFGFSEGKTLSNSGVHSQDYPTADQAVGRSAARRWNYIQDREKVKAEARKKGETHALIRHTGEGFIDYEPMNDRGKVARKKLVREAERILSEKKQ